MAKIGLVQLDSQYFLNNTDSLKKNILLFDELEICKISDDIEFILKLIPDAFLNFSNKRNELDKLLNSGLIKECNEKEKLIEIDKNDQLEVDRKIIILHQQISLSEKVLATWKSFDKKFNTEKKMEDYILTETITTQLSTRSLAAVKNYNSKKDEYIPLIKTELYSNEDDNISKKTKILNLIISKLPVIDDNIPLSQLIEMKEDREFRLKYLAFRDFINTLSTSTLSIKEIDEKIEYLLMDYKNQLHLHNAKYQMTNLETIFVTSAEIIENLAKLKFGKLAKNLISFRNKEIELLEAESKIPGKEIAILHDIHQLAYYTR